MPRRNLLVLLAVTLFSVLCFQRAERNPYARYLANVLQIVDHHALDQVPMQRLFDGAMHGIVNQLDEYSQYISAEEAAVFESELQQEFGGIGVAIELGEKEQEKKQPVVTNVLFGTPAAEAGLRLGDVILKIDGKSTLGLPMDDILKRMRGPVGSPLVLTVRHAGAQQPIDLTLKRAIINSWSVLGDRPRDDGTWEFLLEQDPRIAYVRVTTFGEKTVSELVAALQTVKESGAKALILDLRDDSGGLLEAATAVCDLFLKQDLEIVSIKGRGGEFERSYRTSRNGMLTDLPMTVLVNTYTASASEIVAACLQDHGRAAIIGQRTWGKGTVQHVLRIESGKSILKLTTASYWRPSGLNINRGKNARSEDPWGVMPDEGLKVELNEEQAAKLRRDRLQRDVYQPPQPDQPAKHSPNTFDDPQLDRAIEYLKQKLGSAAHSQAA